MGEASTARGILKSVQEGPAWHGPAMREILSGINAEDAEARPIAHGHSIWELLLHMTTWQEYGLRALEGKETQEMSEVADWLEVGEPSDAAWQEAVREFFEGGKAVQRLLEDVSDEDMRSQVPGRDFTLKVLVHGIVHHNLYHGGQISLLKKAASG